MTVPTVPTVPNPYKSMVCRGTVAVQLEQFCIKKQERTLFMATYNNPFDKAAAFWNKYYPQLQATGGSQAFWDEVVSMGVYFNKDDTEAKLFVLLVEELERMANNGSKNNAARL